MITDGRDTVNSTNRESACRPDLPEPQLAIIIGPERELNRRPHLAIAVSSILFGLGTPLSKLLLKDVPPVALAGLLYLGSFAGLSAAKALSRFGGRAVRPSGPPLQAGDWPWLAGAIAAGGIAGPICLMLGLSQITGTAASLLLNLEGAATALFAVLLFRESAGRSIWLALGCMTLAGAFLTWDSGRGRFALGGSLLVVAAMAAWGLDNNLTRAIADRDSVQIARLKGLVAGAFSFALALALGSKVPGPKVLLLGLLLGAFSYGVSLVLFIRALRHLGAFRTGAFFSFAPFIGALASVAILGEAARWVWLPGAAFMALGLVLLLRERHEHLHRHVALTHTHAHTHDDGHHHHDHAGAVEAAGAAGHVHEHRHEELEHSHGHWPDVHHRHQHGRGGT